MSSFTSSILTLARSLARLLNLLELASLFLKLSIAAFSLFANAPPLFLGLGVPSPPVANDLRVEILPFDEVVRTPIELRDFALNRNDCPGVVDIAAAASSAARFSPNLAIIFDREIWGLLRRELELAVDTVEAEAVLLDRGRRLF